MLNIIANLIYLRICPYEVAAAAGSVCRRLVFFGFWLTAIQPTSNYDMVIVPLKKTKRAVRSVLRCVFEECPYFVEVISVVF